MLSSYSSGSVPMALSIGLVISGPTTMIITQAIAVMEIQLPMVLERFSLSLAPKYWETRIPAPVEMPTKSASKRFTTGVALPTAARPL